MKEQKEVDINILFSPGAHDQIHFFFIKNLIYCKTWEAQQM